MKHDTSKTRKSNKNKASKRRLRNKRRKMQKQMQRKQEQCQGQEEQQELQKEVEPQPQQQKEQQKQPLHEHPKPSADVKTPEQRTLEAQQVWQKTYENAIKWMCSHQVQYWRQRAEYLEHENEMLKAELYDDDEVQQTDEEYITSSSSSSDSEPEEEDVADEVLESDTEVDEGYLKFLEVTRRHREELKKTRAQEAKQLEN